MTKRVKFSSNGGDNGHHKMKRKSPTIIGAFGFVLLAYGVFLVTITANTAQTMASGSQQQRRLLFDHSSVEETATTSELMQKQDQLLQEMNAVLQKVAKNQQGEMKDLQQEVKILKDQAEAHLREGGSASAEVHPHQETANHKKMESSAQRHHHSHQHQSRTPTNQQPTRSTSQTGFGNGRDWEEGVPCQFVFFVGGGKSGSTMVASWLKHNPDDGYRTYYEGSGFLDGGKEICFGSQPSSSKNPNNLLLNFHPTPLNVSDCPANRPFILDGCPHLTGSQNYKHLYEGFGPNSKFIMIVRDPVDRIVSHINDNRPPRRIPDIDRQVLHASGDKKSLSQYGALLDSIVKAGIPKSNVMVVVNEIMKDRRYTQRVMDDVYAFLGTPSHEIRLDAEQANAKSHLDVYSRPTAETVLETQQQYFGDTQHFLELLNVPVLPWKTVRAMNNVTHERDLLLLGKTNQRNVLNKDGFRIAAFNSYLQDLSSPDNNANTAAE